MEINQNIPKISMVKGAPHKMKQWWKNIRREHRDEVRTHLGELTTLMNIRTDKVLTRLLIEFWDPTKVVFKFADFELVPTLEEVTSFTELPFNVRKPVLPVTMAGYRFFDALGLTNSRSLRSIEDGWVSLDQMFDRFGHRESYEWYSGEFQFDQVTWKSLRPNTFAMELLGLLVFPQRRGRININLLPVVLKTFHGNLQATLVPMVLAEMLRALSAYARGYDNFKGYNLLLQIWATEHFFQWEATIDHFVGVSGRAILRTSQRYFIELIGLEGIQPYSPLQVLRQFGMIQDVPLWTRTTLYEDDYNGQIPIPRIRKLQEEWNDLVTMHMGQNSWCTPEYYVWINEEEELARPSREGIAWLEDAVVSL
ncbi:uncharacterized protein [Nicotiana tomentosiformis]|uniref:uncharacterized protein n=1 Tax=Nicotiana tomentosiformis TaxID=4098 RepID=UPI00051C81D4|nr:uncharacterized protein LOC104107746 [Nicotiana tomentosiformis]